MIKVQDQYRQIKPGRALFAAVGLKRIYMPGLLVITKVDYAKAAKLETEIYKVINRFIDGEREGAPLPTDYDHDTTTEMILRELSPEEVTENLAQFHGHEGGDDFAGIATIARQFLQTKIPRRIRQIETFGRIPPPVQPSRSELITFRRQLVTVENPLWAMQNLLAATLGRDHIETLQVVWEDALQAAQTAAQIRILEKITADPKYVVPRRIARQLSVLLGKPDVPDAFVQDLQKLFVREVKQAAQAAEPAPEMDDRLQTTVQRTADHR